MPAHGQYLSDVRPYVDVPRPYVDRVRPYGVNVRAVHGVVSPYGVKVRAYVGDVRAVIGVLGPYSHVIAAYHGLTGFCPRGRKICNGLEFNNLQLTTGIFCAILRPSMGQGLPQRVVSQTQDPTTD
jgi:hypothetical protein